MKFFSKIGLTLMVVVFCGYDVFACSCFLLPLEDGYKDAAAVFTGKVSKPFEYDSNRFMRWQIEVERVWKGNVPAESILVSDRADHNPGLSYCMPEFPVGQTFIFFVEKSANGEFRTIPCSWTSEASTWDPFLNKNPKDKAFWVAKGKGHKPRKK